MNENISNNRPSISVCIACYNGEKFIIEQLESIIRQVSDLDEIIIVDDCSTDSIVDTIINLNDKRINLIINKINIGVNRSFEFAIKMAKNDIIVLADQDDIWIDGRLSLILNSFQGKQVSLVAGNSIYIDNEGKETEPLIGNLKNKNSKSSLNNLLRIFIGSAPYYGCTMAFSNDLKSLILPFPNFIESHDLWIAKCAIIINKIVHIEEPILYRRIHGGNASVVRRTFYQKFKSRIYFFLSILVILLRILNQKKDASTNK